jgi:hypothetical protein
MAEKPHFHPLHFAFELLLYSMLVSLYYLAVLKFSGAWLVELFRNNKSLYAPVALLLIVGQGIVLELITRGLLWLVQPRPRK